MKKPVIKKKTLNLNASKPQIRKPPPPGMRRPNFASLSLPTIENPLDAEPLVEQGLQENVDEETSVALHFWYDFLLGTIGFIADPDNQPFVVRGGIVF